MKWIALLALMLFPQSVGAFYSWQSEDDSGETRGLFRLYGSAYENRTSTVAKKRDAGLAMIARLLVDGKLGSHLGFEANLYQTYIPKTLFSGSYVQLEVERSAQLERSFSNDDYIHLAFDRLNLNWSQGRLDFRVGRQPVNLATTFYFTPNDFFAPFAAQTFYRVYKPGVDAARAEIMLGDLSQLSLISVLGYGQDYSSQTGWSNGADYSRTSTVARLTTVVYDFEWAALAGQVRNINIVGGSIQGELFKWLGIRAEGHVAIPEDSSTDRYNNLTIGLEHRWENSLEARVELFYNGCGANKVAGYSTKTLSTCGSSYPADRYVAVGLSYELTPLLFGQTLLISNLVDQSRLISFNATYSLSDESELVFNINLPDGEKPAGATVKSEFGGYPVSVNLETRIYF